MLYTRPHLELKIGQFSPVSWSKELSLKGKAQYSWRIGNHCIRICEQFYTFLQNFFYLNEEVNCTEPSPSVSVPKLKFSYKLFF